MSDGTEVSYELYLTGSTFFDTVVRLRAGELVKKYPGLSLEEREGRLIFSGVLSRELAREFRDEME